MFAVQNSNREISLVNSLIFFKDLFVTEVLHVKLWRVFPYYRLLVVVKACVCSEGEEWNFIKMMFVKTRAVGMSAFVKYPDLNIWSAQKQACLLLCASDDLG